MGTSIVEYHAPGELVTIDAKSRAGYTFDGWQPGIDAMEVTPISADGTRATFIMPDYNQRIQAKWKLNGSRVNVSGLRLDKESLALNAGDNAKIQAYISPDNATDKVVLWTSSNPLVASVDSKGNVTGLSEGRAEIIARTLEASDKQFTVKCKVSVTGTVAPTGDALEVHLGSPDGKLIGTMDVTDTGGWQKWSPQKCRIEKTTGINDVYFVFKGGEGYLFNLDKFSINYPYENDDLAGDCNLDGEVSVADLVMLQKWLIRKSTELTCWRHAALCKDNTIDVFDLVLLRQKLLEK